MPRTTPSAPLYRRETLVRGRLQLITFHSRKFNSAELNYEIYDKEMLAIIETMDRYRHYFKGLGQTTTIFSDHRNLLWFTETRVYNRRQARWAEKLSRFNFTIVFRPGKQGGKPDARATKPLAMPRTVLFSLFLFLRGPGSPYLWTSS